MQSRAHEPSGLGITFTFLAGILLIGTGLILFMYGLSTLFLDVGGSSSDVPIKIGPTTWGLIRLLVGGLLFVAGCNIFVGKFWARLVGIGVAVIALLAGLAQLDASPVWGVALIALNTAIIWALTRHGTDATLST
jgi:hypothetical protein